MIYFVRPGVGHGTGDGTSYVNAFNDFEGVQWGASAGQVGPGDTLKVCGIFTTMPLQAKANGAVGNPIIIDGDGSAYGDPASALIDGTVNHLNGSMQLLTNRWEWGTGATNLGYKYLVFKNLTVVAESGPGITKGPIKINATTAPGVVDRAVELFVTLDHVHAYTVGPMADELQDCVNGRGSRVRITHCSIHDISHDAVYWEGNNNEFDHNIIARCDLKTGGPGGDCIQFGGAVGIQNTGNWIHHNILDHSNKATKQALIISGDSDLPMFNVVEDNIMIGSAVVCNFNPSGGLIQRNLLLAMNGTTRMLNVERQFGANAGANMVMACDNTLIGSSMTTEHGVFVAMSAAPIGYEIDLYRNTVVGFTNTGIRASSIPLSVRAYHNTVYSLAGSYAFSFGSATTVRHDYNTWYGPAKWQGAGAPDTSTHDVNANPVFIPLQVPPVPVRIPTGVDARSVVLSSAWVSGSGW